MKIARKFSTRGEAGAFKEGLEYLNDSEISFVLITDRGWTGFWVTFYDGRKR
jgi:hypothetical protein